MSCGQARYTPDGLPSELAGWDMDDISRQVRTYSARRLLELRDLTPPGVLWRSILEDEIFRRCGESTT